MCGIFGIVSESGVDPDTLWFGTHRVRHRGPDDWGFAALEPLARTFPAYRTWRSFEDRGAASAYRVGLGSRRLSILDLSEAGRQPMNLPGSDLWIVFNGEIYNYLELRTELSADHDFTTQSDTEVLLAAYLKWGANCLYRLNGMFAFAIWDATRMRLFIARDRFGEKPLYYFQQGQRFVFASEIKQFFADPDFSRQTDRSALSDFFLLSVQDHDERTFFKDVKQLLPAHWMELNLATGNLSDPVRYWMPEIADDFDRSHDKKLEESLVPILQDSIRLRLRSDVPVGICLSGGLDSSAICSLAASETNASSIAAYTMSFPGHREDELSLAGEVARWFGVRHVKRSLCADDLWELLDDFVYFQDGPTGGASILASWQLFQTARSDGTTVLLNGQGGDELFAGYNKFFFFWWTILFGKCSWVRLASSVSNYAARTGLSNWSFANARRYFPRLLQQRLNGIWRFAWPEFRGEKSMIDIGHGNSLNHRLWKDLSQLSLPCLLHWEDRNSMAASAEARLPFLDHRLVETVLQTSVHTKLKFGLTKHSLRKAMSSRLPAEVCWQKTKRGFETPAWRWFTVELARPLEDVFSRKDSLLMEFFDLRAILHQFRTARRTGDNALTEFDWFKLLATNLWLEQLKKIPKGQDAILTAQ